MEISSTVERKLDVSTPSTKIYRHQFIILLYYPPQINTGGIGYETG